MTTPKGMSLIRFKTKESIVGETLAMYPNYMGVHVENIIENPSMFLERIIHTGFNNFEIRKEIHYYQAYSFHLFEFSKQSSSKDYLA